MNVVFRYCEYLTEVKVLLFIGNVIIDRMFHLKHPKKS